MSERKCNECTLCCKLMPVRELGKPANTRCAFQRSGKGCIVHNEERFPHSCAVWNCVWLDGHEDTRELPRPDRAHYVIDPSPDYIELDGHDGLPPRKVMVVQIWVDPKYPNAHRDPKLREWLSTIAERNGTAALVRFDSHKAIALFAPVLTGKDWVEKPGLGSTQHSAQEIYDTAMGAR